MLLHYQIRICISDHSNFNMDSNAFLKKSLYIKLLIITFIRIFDINIENAITFAILEKERKEKLKMLMSYTY